MSILTFILYLVLILTAGLVCICGICMASETNKLDEENRRLKEIIAKNNYKDLGGK